MNILFPHETIRKTQDSFINDILKSIKKKKHIIAHVPTGIGKTAAVLSVLLPYAIENKLTIFFLTTRHTQHKIILETLKLIKEKYNINLQVADFIGKKWMCLQENITKLAEKFGGNLKWAKGNMANFFENLVSKTKTKDISGRKPLFKTERLK